MASSYAEKLRDPRWQKKRLEILDRDNYTCLDCGSSEKTLHVHHCFYEPRKEPWECDNRFLRTLCEDCHEIRGELEADGKRALGIIFSRTPQAPHEDDLRSFVTCLVHMADSGKEDPLSPTVMEVGELEWLTDCRWFREAVENKRFRKGYENVTGHKANWKSIDASRKQGSWIGV